MSGSSPLVVSADLRLVGVQVHNQVLRPPYCYWAAGLTTLLGVVVLLVVLLVPSRAATPPPGPVSQPVVPVPADLVRHTARADRVVALTFDDGPHPEYTPQVLALLARHRAVATFCMIGSEVRRHPELVREVAKAGMRLCAHTVTHDLDLIHRPEPRTENEITGGRQEIRAVLGPNVPVSYFRAPGGRWSGPVQAIAARHGMTPLAWSVDPRDWSRPGVRAIVTTVRQQLHAGAVILLHDGGGRRDQTVAALAELLPWLVAQGYRFDVPA